MTRIVEVEVVDLRFPTSRSLDGSDAMNPDPDYSAAYVILRTDAGDGLEGHGLTFTIGRGTEVVVAAVDALRPLVVGQTSEALFADMGALWQLVADMTPAEQVALVDFRYISDFLTPDAALARLEALAPTRAEREAEL